MKVTVERAIPVPPPMPPIISVNIELSEEGAKKLRAYLWTARPWSPEDHTYIEPLARKLDRALYS